MDAERHRAGHERYAEPWGNGIINWDRLLLDDWRPLPKEASGS